MRCVAAELFFVVDNIMKSLCTTTTTTTTTSAAAVVLSYISLLFAYAACTLNKLSLSPSLSDDDNDGTAPLSQWERCYNRKINGGCFSKLLTNMNKTTHVCCCCENWWFMIFANVQNQRARAFSMTSKQCRVQQVLFEHSSKRQKSVQ